MLKPSQRQSKSAKDFSLHKKIARRLYWHRRLLRCSGSALLVSVGLWFFSAALLWHITAILLGFFLGFLLPFNDTKKWALKWISKEAGLSYQTFLELPKVADTYGFYKAVEERAHEKTRRLKLPSFQAWWLPLMVASLVFLGLPDLAFAPRLTPSGSTTGPLNASNSEASPELSEETPPEESAADPSEIERQDQTGSAIEDFSNSDLSGSDISERIGDQEALSRFLDNLREKEPQAESQEGSPPPPPSEPQASSPSSTAPENSEQEQEQSEQEQQGQTSGQLGEGEESNSAENPEQAEQVAEQANETGDESSDPQTEEGQENAQENNASQAGNQEQNEGQPGDNSARPQDGEGDGVGNTASRPEEADESALNDRQRDPELLQGRLEDGRSSLAGTIQLPGNNEQTSTTSSSSPSALSRAEEQAITEGKIPLEYQEIIRNYFE